MHCKRMFFTNLKRHSQYHSGLGDGDSSQCCIGLEETAGIDTIVWRDSIPRELGARIFGIYGCPRSPSIPLSMDLPQFAIDSVKRSGSRDGEAHLPSSRSRISHIQRPRTAKRNIIRLSTIREGHQLGKPSRQTVLEAIRFRCHNKDFPVTRNVSTDP
jgi:hypothetical protein